MNCDFYLIDVDHEQLHNSFKIISHEIPYAECRCFTDADTYLSAEQKKPCDIAFLEIPLKNKSGLELAAESSRINPHTNVVFLTSHPEYKADAMDLLASCYLMKPVSAAKIQFAMAHLRYPMEGRIVAHCFGNFAIFSDGNPIRFKRQREKEILAYLIDRNGAPVSRKELSAVIFDDGEYDKSRRSQLTHLLDMLEEDLKDVQAEGIFARTRNECSVNMDWLDCDLKDYLNGKEDLYHGEYMLQYTWGEYFSGGKKLPALIKSDNS